MVRTTSANNRLVVSEHEGAGLGLATVRNILSKTGGAVAVESEPGRGTTFVLVFPAAHAASSAVASSPPAAEALRGEGRCLLVVEDDPSVQRVLVRLLDDAGYEVLAADNATAALAQVERGATFHLLVSDLVMPGISGPELAARLRRSRPRLPVLFLSGYHEHETMNRGLLLPPFRFLTKPATRANILGALSELFAEGA